MVTTFNVGAFSALNGIAGANAERLPVIFVVSGYNTNDPGANHIVHHSTGTHDLSYQYEMFRQVTCAAVRILHPDNAPAMIDHAIGTALREHTITAEPRYVRFPAAEYTHVALAEFLAATAKNVRPNNATLTQYHRIMQTAPAQLPGHDSDPPAAQVAAAQVPGPDGDASAALTRAELWHQIEQDLDPATTLLVESGDSWYSGIFTRLPGGARFEVEMQWGAIGWAVPASFGYAKGLEPGRRLVAVIGDGSFQLTAQEVANMIRHGQETLIFVVNNRGYVVESALHDGPYNYIKNWDYAALIGAWNAGDGHGLGLTATTGAELADAISQARQHKGGPVLIECQIPPTTSAPSCSPRLQPWSAPTRARTSRAN